MADYTLDLPEVQVLVNYPLDHDGFFWHHRILLHRIDGASWFALTPDHEIVRHDLNGITHRVLSRRSAFPEDISHEVYAHDPIGRTQLDAFRRQAKVQAVILGQGEPEPLEASTWMISEAGHPKFGTGIDESLLLNAATGIAMTDKGIVVIEGVETFIERVLNKDLETWKKQKGLEGGDNRLLGDHVDIAGKRVLSRSSQSHEGHWER